MSDFDEKAFVESVGGVMREENSSLKIEDTEKKVEEVKTPDAEVKTPEADIKTPSIEEVKTPEADVNTPSIEEVKTPAVEEKVIDEEPKTKFYKGHEIMSNIEKEFEETYDIPYNAIKEILNTNYDDENFDERVLVEDYLINSQEGITDKEISTKLKKYDVLFKTDEEIDDLLSEGKITNERFDELEGEWLQILREGKNYLKNTQGRAQKMLDEFEVEQIENSNNTDAKAQKDLLDRANSFSPTFSKETLEIKDKDGNVIDSIEFSTDDSSKQLVTDVLSDPSLIYSLWTEDGILNVDKMFRDVYELKNRTHMRKAIYDQAYSKGAASIAKDQSNIDFDPVRKSTGTETPIPDGLREAFSYINGVK